MKQKLETLFCIATVATGVCGLIAIFLLTHPSLFNTIRNEIENTRW